MASLLFIGLIACCAIGVSAPIPPATYSVTDLGVITGMDASEPAAINTEGQVAGTASGAMGKCVFMYHDGKIQDISGLDSRGFSINPAGLVVGDSAFYRNEMANHAAIFKGGTKTDLGVLPGGIYSRANGINASEQVVGFSGPKRDSEASRAFVWSAWTGIFDIGTLGGAYAQAWAVNDVGFVTGTAQTADGFIGATHAFLYQIPPMGKRNVKPMLDLQTLGGASSYGLAINAYNHVVGYSEISLADDRVHAFFYRGEKLIDLGSLGGGRNQESDYSAALGINSADQVVGYTYTTLGGSASGNRQVAFICDMSGKSDGVMIDLNQLIGRAAQRYWLASAVAISDMGEIVATAFDVKTGTYRGVMLTPVGQQNRRR
jgi:probable HAF family extracellular repeat protein